MAKAKFLVGWGLVGVFAWPLMTWQFMLVILGVFLVSVGGMQLLAEQAERSDDDGATDGP